MLLRRRDLVKSYIYLVPGAQWLIGSGVRAAPVSSEIVQERLAEQIMAPSVTAGDPLLALLETEDGKVAPVAQQATQKQD